MTMDRHFKSCKTKMDFLTRSFEKETTISGHEVLNKLHVSIRDTPPAAQIAASSHFAQKLKRTTVRLERNEFFQGRAEILEDIHSKLDATATRGVRKCVITGMGGSGKTQVALEYTYRYQGSYDSIFWIDAELESTLIENYANILAVISSDVEISGEKETIQKVKDWLSTTSVLSLGSLAPFRSTFCSKSLYLTG